MWFNLIYRVKSYQFLGTSFVHSEQGGMYSFYKYDEYIEQTIAGVAWLSSARVMKCTVNSWNERNPYRQ